MKQMKKYVWLVVSMLVMLLVALEVMAAVPASPSIITMNGKQMRVQHRREDNTLKTAVNYVIKGVCWSVGSTWPVETYLPGAPFENDNRYRMWEMAAHDFPRIREAGFNTIRLYMDVGMNTDSTLYYDEDTNNVIWNADGTAQDDDSDHQEDWLEGMAMVGQMSAAAVTNGTAVMDEAYKNGLKVIMVVDHFNNNSFVTQKLVNTYKNHPALLMWMIGNEYNYNFSKYTEGLYMYRYDTFLQACQGAEATAAWIQANDANHPVAACLGEPAYPTYADYKAGVAAMTDVDILGINSYRGKSFGTLYETFVDTVTWTKPIFFSEYGVDTWHYNATDQAKEFEDLAGQKEGAAFQWDEVHSRLSSKNSADMLLGSCVFEWVDEWWKYERSNNLIHDILPGYPINGGLPVNADLYPDGCMHEEFWGLNAQDSKNVTPITFYSDAGLVGESQGGEQSWDLYTWGLPIDGTGYGKLQGQSTYVTTGVPDNGVRKSYSPYFDFTYNGVDTIPEGQRCMYTELWSEAYGVGWGVFRTKDTIDVSQYASGNLKVWIKLQNAGSPPTAIGDARKGEYFFKFEDENGPEKAVFIWLDESYCSEFNATSTAWQEVTIPLSALCDGHQYVWQDKYGYKNAADSAHKAVLNLAKMKMVFAFSARPKASGAGNTQFWVDNVRWDTGASVTYNRIAHPAVKDYNAKYNALSYLKSIFEAGAVSYTGTGAKYSRCTKNFSAVIYKETDINSILAAAIDPKTGRVVNTQDLTSASAVNTWIDIYNDAGDNYILAFAKFNQGSLPTGCTNLAGIGSTLYSTVASADPWVFVTHAVNGSSIAKKESIGASSLADIVLVVQLDYDSDGLNNLADSDTDGDGLSNVLEARYGTDVLDTDTDDDTYTDSTEITNGTNPRNPDSKVLTTDTQAALRVDPDLLAYGNKELQVKDKGRYLYIMNDGGERLVYKVDIAYTNGSGWIAVKYKNATTGAWTAVTTGSYLYDDLDEYMLQVSVDTTTMTTAQTYAATVTVTANDEDGTASGSQAITVSVPIAPELNVIPGDIKVKKPDTGKKIYIENSGCATLSYTISKIDTSTGGWLTISPTNGSATTETDPIDLTVNWTSITADTFTVIKVDGGTAGVKYITVNCEDVTGYGLNYPLKNVDGSYIGRQTSDFRECMAMASGDVDKDGCEDVLVGALQYFTAYTGKAYLFMGKKEGWHMDSSVTDGIEFLGTNEDNSFYAGTGVALADVNGDGWLDIIIGDKCAYYDGAPGSFANQSGAIYIFFNKQKDLKKVYSMRDADIVIRAHDYFWDDFGDVIASGDVNGDGYDDLIVGADNTDDPGAYVIFGRTQAEWDTYLATSYSYVAGEPKIHTGTGGYGPPLTDVTEIYHSLITDTSSYNWWRWCDFITVGDLNNDGYDDIILGNLEYPAASGTWYRYVIYGKAGKQSAWGSDLDVYNNLTVAIPIVATGVANQENLHVGWTSADGDVNGDGCNDILISTGSTKNYILFGSTTKWTAQKTIPTDANVTLNLPYKSSAPERPAWAHIAKDMNNDGKDEVVISGAVWDSGSEPAEIYLYLGRATFPATVDLATAANASFLAETGADDSCEDYGWQFLPAWSGDYNGDTYNDLAVVLENNSEAAVNGGQMYMVLNKRFMTTADELIYRVDTETTQTFNVKNVNIDGTAIDWTATEAVSWITGVSPASGTGLAYNSSTPITVTISRTGLGDGVYTGYITLTSGGYSSNVKVTLYVGKNIQPLANADPEHLVIFGTSGTFALTNIGGGTMNWTITENETWITSVSPTSSTTGTETDTITVNVNRTGLTNDLSGKVTITYDNGMVKDVYVTMAIPKIRIGSTYYSTIQAAYNAATTGQTIQVQDGTFTETLTFNRAAIAVTIEGGYNYDWSLANGTTRIVGNVTENSTGGSVTFGSTGAVSIQ